MSGAEEREALKRVGQKLLRCFEEYLDRAEEPDLKDLKTITGALKELQSLWDDGQANGGALTVRFEGEAEEMSI
ncbi:MAG: hypothetical protein IJV51_06090 [Oscillospiraceae bacterium]|nr:hypothetical protein [Oscillospiraceae bacterium]